MSSIIMNNNSKGDNMVNKLGVSWYLNRCGQLRCCGQELHLSIWESPSQNKILWIVYNTTA